MEERIFIIILNIVTNTTALVSKYRVSYNTTTFYRIVLLLNPP
jgi:hypothetical protein